MADHKVLNLLPHSEQKELHYEVLVNQIKDLMIWLVLSMLVIFMLSILSEQILRVKISNLDREITQNQLDSSTEENKALQNEIKQINLSVKNLQALDKQHYYWSNALIELTNILPLDVRLNFISFDRTSKKIDISGVARDRDSIIQLWSDLHKSRYFNNINFPLSNLEKPNDGDFSFS